MIKCEDRDSVYYHSLPSIGPQQMLMELYLIYGSNIFCQSTQRFGNWSYEEKEGGLSLGKWASLIHEPICSTTFDPFLFPLEPFFKNCALKKKQCWFKSSAVASKETNVKSSAPPSPPPPPRDKCYNHSAARALLLWILLMCLKESLSLNLSWILKKRPLWGLRFYLLLPSFQCPPKEAFTG